MSESLMARSFNKPWRNRYEGEASKSLATERLMDTLEVGVCTLCILPSWGSIWAACRWAEVGLLNAQSALRKCNVILQNGPCQGNGRGRFTLLHATF